MARRNSVEKERRNSLKAENLPPVDEGPPVLTLGNTEFLLAFLYDFIIAGTCFQRLIVSNKRLEGNATTSILADNLIFVLPVLALQKLNYHGFDFEQQILWIHGASINLAIFAIILNFVEIALRQLTSPKSDGAYLNEQWL